MSTGLWSALRKRYAAPEYAWFEEMRNGTGFSRKQDRTADAMAFGTWPSRGLLLHGFEVKVSRSDWLREKKQPEKSVELQRFCDHWWLVTTEGCVLDASEVPVTWGWLEWNGKKLVTKREAPLLEAQPLDRPMLASILRRAADLEALKVEERANELAKERIDELIASNQVDRREWQKERQTLSDERNNFVRLLNQISDACGVEWAERRSGQWAKVAVSEWSPEALAKFELFKAADLTELRRGAAEAFDTLRRATTQARLALRSAGVRTSMARRGSS